jgi:2-polyprenyl-3-methyl-5-hydroxy-6-metoxy-1,4-benzoquinol methylase
VAFEVLEHVKTGELFLEKCHSLLGPGGRLIVSVPPDTIRRSPFHVEAYTLEKIRGMLDKGFIIEDEYLHSLKGIAKGIEGNIDDCPAMVFICKKRD